MTTRLACFILTAADLVKLTGLSRGARERLLHPAEVVTYHRLAGGRGPDHAFLRGVSAGRFAEQIAYLARNYEVVPLRLLVECMREGKAWPRRALAISFDDGYRDNYELAYPVLRMHRVPATVFLTAGAIDQQQLLWWDRVHRVITDSRVRLQAADLPPGLFPTVLRNRWETYDATSFDGRAMISLDVVAQLKQVPDAVRLAVVEDLPKRLGVESPEGHPDDALLSWPEIREMAAGGIDFGAHTLTHPSLDRIDSRKLRLEVEGSKLLIEERIQRPVTLFAYPGGSGASDAGVREVLKSAGFSGAVRNQGFSNTARTDSFGIGRRSVPDEPICVLEAILNGWFDAWRVVKFTIPFGSADKR